MDSKIDISAFSKFVGVIMAKVIGYVRVNTTCRI